MEMLIFANIVKNREVRYLWIMTYDEAMNYMNEIGKRGSIFGLEPVTELLRRLGNPQEQLSVIHVAGTNGKGSICTFLEAMYRSEDRRVGRYISPTLHCYLERIQINGDNIAEESFAKLLTDVKEELDNMEREGREIPTAFEVETAIAFLYFLRERVDLVILETGMGGRLDATNVVSKPLCTVFASIGMDHMQFLGDTLERIAYAKAGIIKDNCPVVSYPSPREAVAVLRQECSLHNTEMDVVSIKDIRILSEDIDGSSFSYKGSTYYIAMAGEYQIYNAVTAIETKLLLDGFVNSDSLHNARWEGRFEVVSKSPFLLKDGAHNIDGVNALKKSIEKHFTNEKKIFIIGVLKDKEYKKMMSLLCPGATAVFTVTPPGERGLSADFLADCIRPYCAKVTACKDVKQALLYAKREYYAYKKMGDDAVIVAWGSLSYMGQITSDEQDKSWNE